MLFENFCDLYGIRWKRIPTGDTRTPDYDISVVDQKVIIEVKQMDPNPEEEKEEEKLLGGGVEGLERTLGARVRQKITDASSQIANRAKGRFPSLLVLYNNVSIAFHTDPYAIIAGMYGEITAVIARQQRDYGSSYLKEWKFSAKRKMTKAHNTSISAIGVLMRFPDGKPYLVVYHNVYANIPLDYKLLCPFVESQFTLKECIEGKYQNWIEID